MISQIHQVPGRLRITIPGLKQQVLPLRQLCSRLEAVAGVQKVSFSAVTGSVVVHFRDSEVVAGSLINHITAQLGIVGLHGFPSRRRYQPASRHKTSTSGLLPPGFDMAVKFAVRIFVPVLVGKYLGKPAGRIAASLL